jgi:hypothetical protein
VSPLWVTVELLGLKHLTRLMSISLALMLAAEAYCESTYLALWMVIEYTFVISS